MPFPLLIKIKSALAEYWIRIRLFQPNARLYLVNVVVVGVAMGIFRLLFNFYILSLGYNEALLGELVTISSLVALLAAIPSGYLADQLGRKKSMLIAGVLMAFAILIMVIWSKTLILYIANILLGLAQSLGSVTMGPFLMENSNEEERTYLFSFGSGLQMASASVGNWIGGSLPTWMGSWLSVDPTASLAYGGAIVIVSLIAVLAIVPIFFIKTPKIERSERSAFTPLEYAIKQPVMLSKLILPILFTSIGAGLIMPFMNVFFREVYHQPDPVIGTLFAWGSLAMGLGLLIAPPLADRAGKIQLVVVTQGLSIPFLVLLGFSPWFWLSAAAYYVRLVLMNMSSPIYQTFVMECVEMKARATVASLVSMSWNFGWAFSPMVSGYLQVRYGFDIPFLGTLILYSISIVMYWVFFGAKKRQNRYYQAVEE